MVITWQITYMGEKNETGLRDNRTIPYIIKVVGDVVDHGHAKLPELLSGCHPQGLPLKETCKFQEKFRMCKSQKN